MKDLAPHPHVAARLLAELTDLKRRASGRQHVTVPVDRVEGDVVPVIFVAPGWNLCPVRFDDDPIGGGGDDQDRQGACEKESNATHLVPLEKPPAGDGGAGKTDQAED